jgi:hypothetical protein
MLGDPDQPRIELKRGYFDDRLFHSARFFRDSFS